LVSLRQVRPVGQLESLEQIAPRPPLTVDVGALPSLVVELLHAASADTENVKAKREAEMRWMEAVMRFLVGWVA
jgi:hypothetical protein